MIDIETKKSGDVAVLRIRGDLDVLHATRLREVLIETLSRYQSVAIHVEEMESIDLSCLQLFCAAHKMALNMNKELIVAGVIPAVIRQAVIHAGYARRIGCSLDKNNSCMWIKEAKG